MSWSDFWNTAQYWVPGYNVYLYAKNRLAGESMLDMGKHMFGIQTNNEALASQAQSVADESRAEYLADREHTEMREDTAYQRAVADMRAAGLNPATIGASGASSSASNVGANSINAKLQVLGYILDLKNLDAKNRKITNDAIGDILGFVKKK